MQKLECCKPEEIGVSSRSVIYFLEALERARIPLHSLMIIRNGRVAAEVYYEPYEKNMLHRFYSTTADCQPKRPPVPYSAATP